MTIGNIFLTSAIKRLRYYKELGEKALAQITDADCHYSPGEESNSIAIIIQHMSGNMISRWTDFLTTDGEKEWRDRDGEFEINRFTKEELFALWEKGWGCCFNCLEQLTKDDLLSTIYIRKEALTVTDAINRQLAHYPYHVGQVIYIAKMVRNNQWNNLSMPKNPAR